ncbi:MAG: hypothetical protein J6M64_09870 [Oscillospiraceae bacterium]|nr:hypothetical protein [Oscillospiraceae bacterium]
MTFEEFINRKLDLDEQAYKIGAKIQLLRAQAEKSTSAVSLAPGGIAYDDSRLEELVLKIADLEKEEKSIENEMAGVSAELSTFLTRLSSPIQMKILMMRYVDLMPFDAIARKVHFTSRSMYRYHRKGLAEAKALYEGVGN